MINKILNNKILKIGAIILLPTVLVGGYYGVKWIIKKKRESKNKKIEEINNKENENI